MLTLELFGRLYCPRRPYGEAGGRSTWNNSCQERSRSTGSAYQNAWEKLLKYYELTDDAHSIYAAAISSSPFTPEAIL